MSDQQQTPLTDAFDVNLDMQDLSIGHKLREWKTHARSLELKLQEADRQRDEARKQVPCKIREHFCACPNCEPVMCCSGNECGCQGLPVDFKPTEKCDGYCLNKTHRDLQAIKAERDQLIKVVEKFHEAHEACTFQDSEELQSEALDAYSLLPHVQARK